MTTAINLDSVPKVRKAAAAKPDVGTTWYSHDGDKYPCLYLGVGKRAASWYFKGRLNGRSQQKALKATFPETTAAQAFEKIATLTEYHAVSHPQTSARFGTLGNITAPRDSRKAKCRTDTERT